MIQFVFKQYNKKTNTVEFPKKLVGYIGLVKDSGTKYLVNLEKGVDSVHFNYIIDLLNCLSVGDFDAADIKYPFFVKEKTKEKTYFHRKSIWKHIGEKTEGVLKRIDTADKAVSILNLAHALKVSEVIELVSLWSAIQFIDGRSACEIKKMFGVDMPLKCKKT